ncbi:phosphodiesterase [Pseudorhodoplanes sp.]|uniref:phosphodiesterase n=1 Tax=Pseudorhodoplanes sp. TaxID=1934341 RepID=UPI00391D9051
MIVQISDLHVTSDGHAVCGVVPTNAMAKRAVGAILRLAPRPDLVLVSGDLTEHGEPEEYAALANLLSPLPMPVYAVPGNHDRREAMRSAFGNAGFLAAQGPLNFTIDAGPLRIVGLDSLVEGKSHGVLLPETLDHLDRSLTGAPDRPALVMLHHPPFVCGIAHMDKIRLLDGAEELGRILSGHRQVKRLITGHVHRPVLFTFAGIPCQIAPSVAHQVALELTLDGPASFTLEPPSMLIHRFDEAHGLTTHMAYVDSAPGPYRF